MDFLSIEQLASLTGKSRRTVDRKLSAFKKKFPDRFTQLTRLVNCRIEYSPEFLEILGISDEIVEAVKQDLIEPEPEPEPKYPNVPHKERKRKPKPETTAVIRIDDVPADQEKELADFKLIMEDYKTGQYALHECVARHNVHLNDFWYWVNNRPAFGAIFDETYKNHKKAFNVHLRELAKESLKKMVTGYNIVMESTTFQQKVGPNGEVIHIPQERRVQQKYIIPNGNLIQFALTNKDPDEWKRVFGNTPITATPEQDPLEKMSDAELLNFIDEAKKQGLLSSSENS